MTSHNAPQAVPSSYSSFSLRSRRSTFNPAELDDQAPPPSQRPANRRDSRMGLRHIFSRSKLGKDKDSNRDSNTTPRHVPEAQTSTMDAYYTLNHPSSHSSTETALQLQPTSSTWSTSRGRQPYSQSSGPSFSARRSSIQPAEPADSLAAWEMPQLFKAYPQAIRQATLPAVTLSTETVLRLHDQNATTAAENTDQPKDKAKDKVKKKHRRNASLSNLQWTTKIYLLATSGYLLQYAGDGHYDRQPECALKLNHNSAAFVTDSIPGQHWVLQISSNTEPDMSSSQEPKSLLQKLPFRARDKQETSNILMVFESAGEMDGWMAALRAQIEKLGGRRKLSETGKPQTNHADQIRERSTSRPIVVRDPRRFSRNPSKSPIRKDSRQDSDDTLKAGELDNLRDHCIDDNDTSTTNSFVSQDGKRLESLRDSGNRYSFVSSGQPTVVTSAASSPSPSPTVDTFARNSQETTSSCDNLENLKALEARPRPNAAVIASRRSSSLQAGGLFINLNHDGTQDERARDTLVYPANVGPSEQDFANATPNFSVPKSSSRRYSHLRGSSKETNSPPSPSTETVLPTRPVRSKPPPSLRHTRPLSMVMDQASPKAEMPARPPTADPASHANRPLSPAAERYRRGMRYDQRSHMGGLTEYPSRRSSMAGSDAVPRTTSASSPRRRVVHGVIHEDGVASIDAAPDKEQGPSKEMAGPPVFTWGDEKRQRRVSMEPSRTFSTSPRKANRRVSLNPASLSHKAHRRHSSSDERRPTLLLPPVPPPPKAPPPSGPLPAIPSCASNPHLTVDRETRVLMNRRSMPQMPPQGPPPAPPPMRSLPPIPRNHSIRT